MFIAHAPSGYILSTEIVRRLRSHPSTVGAVVAVGIFGALAPDFDMFYFYLVDNRQTHHHKYISHWPLFWLGLTALGWAMHRLWKSSPAAFLFLVFSAAGFLHMLLDSFVGDIWWLAPFVDKPFAFFTVPARFKPWWLNFILHWSFAVELLICAWAVFIYHKRTNPSVKGTAE